MMSKKIHNYIIVYGYCVCSCRPHFKAWVDDSPKLSLQTKLDRASASKDFGIIPIYTHFEDF